MINAINMRDHIALVPAGFGREHNNPGVPIFKLTGCRAGFWLPGAHDYSSRWSFSRPQNYTTQLTLDGFPYITPWGPCGGGSVPWDDEPRFRYWSQYTIQDRINDDWWHYWVQVRRAITDDLHRWGELRGQPLGSEGGFYSSEEDHRVGLRPSQACKANMYLWFNAVVSLGINPFPWGLPPKVIDGSRDPRTGRPAGATGASAGANTNWVVVLTPASGPRPSPCTPR